MAIRYCSFMLLLCLSQAVFSSLPRMTQRKLPENYQYHLWYPGQNMLRMILFLIITPCQKISLITKPEQNNPLKYRNLKSRYKEVFCLAQHYRLFNAHTFGIPGHCFDLSVQSISSSKSLPMPLVIITLSQPQSNTHQNHNIDTNIQTWGLGFIYILEATQEINLLFFYQEINKIHKMLQTAQDLMC